MASTQPYTVGERLLFIPRAIPGSSESPALEEVRLIRDEMANMAWAVEAIVQDELGLPVSGYDLSLAGERRTRERARLRAVEAVRMWRPLGDALQEARDKLIRRRGQADETAAAQALADAQAAEAPPRAVRDAAIAEYERLGGDARDLSGLPDAETEGKIVPTYKLLAEVPRNWIPLIPRPTGVDGQMMLRPGAMPELHGAGENQVPERIRARGVLLRPDVRPFVLYEEEVPRVGVHVTRTAQFARWLNGTTHFWIGRRKAAGRGEGWSGLKFDRVEDAVQR